MHQRCHKVAAGGDALILIQHLNDQLRYKGMDSAGPAVEHEVDVHKQIAHANVAELAVVPIDSLTSFTSRMVWPAVIAASTCLARDFGVHSSISSVLMGCSKLGK